LSDLKAQVQKLREEFEAALRDAADAPAVQGLRDRFVGRKSGAVTALMKSLAGLAADARKDAGQELNALKEHVEARLEEARARLESRLRDERLARERVDVPGGRAPSAACIR
jgi:phenylalanyl-tRNA synthetase alpha chain